MMDRDLIYLEHILESIEKIHHFVEGLDKTGFEHHIMIQDAVIRNFEIIGEATKRLSESCTRSHPELPWQDMAGMRDKLIHHYLDVDLDVVWTTIKIDIPVLQERISAILGRT